MIAPQQQLKLIFKGRLEFGTERAYKMVVQHWTTRMESYFKTDVLFKMEQVLIDDEMALIVPQQVIMSTERPWRSTTALLQEAVQFAVVGKIQCWCLDNGKLLSHLTIEPHSDKTAVAEYWRGCALVEGEDSYDEATEALSRAIDKYERHALAYERRGYVNYKLRNFNDALHDFSKSISINQNNPEPYYGAGKVRMLKNEWEQAAGEFDQAIKKALALQPVHWLARLRKGESLFHAKQFEEAAKDLRLFLARSFSETDPNFQRRRRALVLLGRALAETNDLAGSEEAFKQALSTGAGSDLTPDNEALLQLGIVQHRVGKPEFARNLRKAAAMGCPEAARLIAAWEC